MKIKASLVCPKCGESIKPSKRKSETFNIHSHSVFGFLELLEYPSRFRVNCSHCGYPYIKLPDKAEDDSFF